MILNFEVTITSISGSEMIDITASLICIACINKEHRLSNTDIYTLTDDGNNKDECYLAYFFFHSYKSYIIHAYIHSLENVCGQVD